MVTEDAAWRAAKRHAPGGAPEVRAAGAPPPAVAFAFQPSTFLQLCQVLTVHPHAHCAPSPSSALQNPGLPLGCDPTALAGGKALPPPVPPAAGLPGEPLRPANQQAPGGGEPPEGPQGAAQQQQQHAQPPPAPAGWDEAALAAAAATGASIDWSDQRQVTHLLHCLHMERLRRAGLPPPADYQQPHPPPG